MAEAYSIVGGRLIDPEQGLDGNFDLHIADGRVLAVGAPPQGFEAARIDAQGCVICPGLIDLHARLREPGQEHKGTIASETAAAAAGGVTTLCCPPDTDPVIDTPAVIRLIRQRAEEAGHARVLPLGALTLGLAGERLAEMNELREAGCIGYSNAAHPITNTLVMRRAMEYAASCGLPVFLAAEDAFLSPKGYAHEGAVSTRLGLPGLPESAETIIVARDLLLIEQTGVRAHFCKLSTARAVQMVGEAQRRGLPVTAQVTAHHLHLSEMDLGYFNSDCHVQPPLRTQRDMEGLRAGLASGVISAVCSDHQPHDPDAKLAPFSESEPGISALETLLPLALRLGEQRVMSLPDVVARLTRDPARILGIDAGHLRPGAAADVCVFDPERYWTLAAEGMHSRGRNTPFLGWEFKGRVTHTFLAGRLVYQARD
ncbi:dihydroorotase [Ectothiorhodospiraceae bacterium 2226]|nr:dihydroorotase [Ectothiorhodospiraceae bacterium 2226]